jgi:hypothetical protein
MTAALNLQGTTGNEQFDSDAIPAAAMLPAGQAIGAGAAGAQLEILMPHKPKMRVREIPIALPKGDRKCIAGSHYDDWNDWLTMWTSMSLPIDHNDEVTAIKAATALYSGMIDMRPADPVEGIIISQLMVANHASLAMYQKAWAQPAQYFEAHTKYLQLADKAARTVALLTERLDHHRNRGQQKIVVQHTTVNADQAVVATGNATDPALLTASVVKPLQMIGKTIEPELVGVGEKKE